MEKSRVAVIRCESYQEEEVQSAVQRGLDLLGGVGSLVRRGEKVLLKPNVLAGEKPERCVSTHPSVLKAAGRIFQQAGADLRYGDSSGFGKPASQMRKAGLSQVAEQLGIPLTDFEKGSEVIFTNSPFTKKFIIAQGVLESDCIISLSKMKTHQLTRFTGAVKNQFGCIPGMLKPEFHVKMQSALDFSKMLVTLNLLLKPRFFIMDGVMAMEGNGPRSGDPVRMNVLLFSGDPVALDAAACRMIDLDPEYVPTSRPGREWGLGVYARKEIEMLGDPIEDFINRSFNVNRVSPLPVGNNRGMLSVIRNVFTSRPVIDPHRCVRCGVCVTVCPVKPKALNWREEKVNPPRYIYRNCIRCFCCQELCPERAIHVKTPPLGRLVFGEK
ncbi:MAG: hypothetical protein AMS17_06850 [Spirochaetes bacterium DG_61]|nr:MAG: hypothetical protein AMS17_06850 [Spirochaetes bacterium DG_61]